MSKLGISLAESSGQPYYPIYLFGPYKLLCVIVGCTIAFVWTIFPYPISARSKVRKALGRSLFILANLYGCMHTTIKLWIHEAENDPASADFLEAAKDQLFAESMSLLRMLKINSHFTTYEPPLGGKFPKSIYDAITSEIQDIVISLTLMTQRLNCLPDPSLSRKHLEKEDGWIRQLSKAVKSTDFDSHAVTSVLCHLSAAVSNGLKLPPYLSPRGKFPLARKVKQLNDSLLHVTNSDDPAFAEFAYLEVLSSLMDSNLTKLIRYFPSPSMY